MQGTVSAQMPVGVCSVQNSQLRTPREEPTRRCSSRCGYRGRSFGSMGSRRLSQFVPLGYRIARSASIRWRSGLKATKLLCVGACSPVARDLSPPPCRVS